jgi:hypothetical protein
LAVHGGKTYGALVSAQGLRDLPGGEGLLGALFQTAEDGLPLFRVIRHVIISNLKIILNLYGYYRTPGEKVKGG